MASIDSLPADQRAVLELVLRRGRSYDEIARLLSIDRAGVRQRALAALDTLGPQTRVAPDRRALITDYLLDALPEPVAAEVRERLGGSASERAWARAVASELQALAARPLPEIPANGARPPATAKARPRRGTARRDGAAAAPRTAPAPDGAPPEGRSRGGGRSSRRGGALLLGLAAAVAIALVLVFVVFSGGASHRPAARRPAGATRTTTASTPTVLSVIALTSPKGGKSPAGAAEFVRIDGRMGVAIAAEGLAPNPKTPPNYYAAWLYNSPTDAYFLGYAAAVGSGGQLRTGGFVPSNAVRYHHLLLTLEAVPKGCTTSTCKPKTPGRIVLEGTVKSL
jgi:hypothetical protein